MKRGYVKLFLVAGLAQITAGCSEGVDAGDLAIQFKSRDSAGVVIAVTSGLAARTPLEWVVDSLPDLQFGGIDGTGPHQFAGITGVRMLSSGDVVVVDGGSRELRLFDDGGTLLSSLGGRGEGPGEFQSAQLVVRAGIVDSLWIYDFQRRRFTVFSPEQGSVRTFQVPNRTGCRQRVEFVRANAGVERIIAL